MTGNNQCVIVHDMGKTMQHRIGQPAFRSLSIINLIFILPGLIGLISLACSLPIPTATDSASPSINTQPPTFTPIPTATNTPLPTPTPIPSARIESAEEALKIGDWSNAFKEYQIVQDVSTDTIVLSTALLGMGNTYYLSGNFYESINTLNKLIIDYPESVILPAAYFQLAISHEALDHYADAAQAYSNYLELRPGVIDGYVYERRADNLFAAGNYIQAASDYRSALKAPSLLDKEWIELKAARALALSGDYQTAIDLYDQIYNKTNNDNTKALINLRKGEIYTLQGQVELANSLYLEAVTNYPKSYESYTALVELVDMGVPVDDLQRGIVDYYAGQYGVAIAAFNRYLLNNPTDPATAYYFSGLANRATGGYNTAINQWEKVTQDYPDHIYWDDAWEEMVYTQWAYLDQYSLAIENLQSFVSSAPLHPRAAEFLFDAAAIAEIAGNLEQAAELWEKVASSYPGYEQANRALFLSGITQFRMGNYSRALSIFQRLNLQNTDLEERAATRLWIGKTHQALGDINAAKLNWENAANTDPTGYYSERARDLLRDHLPFEPPIEYDLVYDKAKKQQQAEEWLRTKFSISEGIDLNNIGELNNDQIFIRAQELWNLGLLNEARNELEHVRKSYEADPVMSYRLMNYFLDIGLYRSAILASRQVLELAGMDDAGTMNAPAYFNYVRFGTYYSDLIIQYAEEYNFHPLFLFSVIRQESLFESFIRSSASASGLMQIMPATGEDIARNTGWPPNYSTEDLYRPIVNIYFGIDYLDTQRNAFNGELYSTLAAYNGGPGNAREWNSLAPDDPDLFLEIIRFAETREYIRSVFENYSIYNLLYNRTP